MLIKVFSFYFFLRKTTDLVNMDHHFERDEGTAVLCGRACTAETGWVGKVCGNQLKIRFRSDHMVSDIGWKIKWILRPKEDCECHCEEEMCWTELENGDIIEVPCSSLPNK